MHYSSPLSWNICIRSMKKEVMTEGELSVATVCGIKQWSLPDFKQLLYVTIEKKAADLTIIRDGENNGGVYHTLSSKCFFPASLREILIEF